MGWDGLLPCWVGFLPCHMAKHVARYNGSLMQVTRVFSAEAEKQMHHHNRGCCLATIISCLHAVSSVKGEEKDKDKIGKEMAKRKCVV